MTHPASSESPRVLGKRRAGLLVVLLAVLWGASFGRDARGEGLGEKAKRNKDAYVAALRMIEAKLRANYEQIATWSGTYELKDESFQPSYPKMPEGPPKLPDAQTKPGGSGIAVEHGNFWMERKVLVRYAVDMKEDRLFTTFEVVGPTTLLNLDTKQTMEAHTLPHRERHVLTGEHWMKSTPASGPQDVGPSFARGKGTDSATRRAAMEVGPYKTYSSVVDPRELFCVSGKPFYRVLGVNAEWLEAGKPLWMELVERPTQAGVQYTLRQEFRPKSDLKQPASVAEFVFDPAAGYHVISSRSIRPSGMVDEEREWEYTLISGVYIPKRHHLKKYKRDSKELALERDLRLVDAKINEPLDKDVFTWGSLGLQEGDQIRDEIEGKTLRFQHGAPVAAAEYVDPKAASSDPAAEPTASGRWRTVLVVNGAIAVVAIAIVLLVRRHRRRRSS